MEDSRTVESHVTSRSRRGILRAALGAAALFLLQGCRTSSSNKEFERSKIELRQILKELGQDEQEKSRLAAIAEKIIDATTKLVEENQTFLRKFHEQSKSAEVTANELRKTITVSESRRTKQRHAALQAQDELRAELTAEEWAEAIRVLNRKAASAAQPAREG